MASTSLKKLFAMECAKLPVRINVVFCALLLAIVTLQISVAVRLDMEATNSSHAAELVYYYAAKYVGNIAFTFIPLLLLINVSREFEQYVVRRTLISGLSRRDYFLAKCVQLGLYCLLSLLFYVLFAIITALLFKVPITIDRDALPYLVVPFPLGCLALAVACVLKRTSMSVMCFASIIVLDHSLSALMASRDIRLALPFNTCVQWVREGVYDWTSGIVLAAAAATGLLMAYWKIKQGDV